MMDAPLKFVPPGGYRACANCASAKAKCIQPDEGAGKCERCQRLDKDCHIIPRAKKRRRPTEPSQPGTGRLDDGIDVAVAARRESVSGHPPGGGQPGGAGGGTGGAEAGPLRAGPGAPSPTLGFRIGEEEAEKLLQLFRDHMHPLNPFVELEPATTAAQLRVQRPMLFLAVMFAASYHDFDAQKAMSRSIMTYISEQMFQQGRRSLQLLQGVIVFLHWYSSQLFVNPQVTNLLHITMALTTDLGLDKAEGPRLTSRSPMARFPPNTFQGPQAAPEEHTVHERRALAAAFYITSSISSNTNMLTALQYSAQVGDVCRLFEAENRDDPLSQDYRLAKLVRLQYIIARIYNAQKEADLAEGRRFPYSLFIRQFEEDLQKFWALLPAELRSDITILLLYHTAEIHLYKMSLTDADFAAGTASSAVEHPEEMHVNCLIALKSWFDVFFGIPTSSYFYVPITIYVQLAHADVTLAKLTAFWSGRRPDRSPPEFPPFADIMENLGRRFDEAKNQAHPLGRVIHNDVFDQWATRIRSFKSLDFSRPGPPNPPSRDATPAGSLSVNTPGTGGTPGGGGGGSSSGAGETGQTTPETATADWATWFDGLQTSWIVGEPEPVTWQSSYDMWNLHGANGPSF